MNRRHAFPLLALGGALLLGLQPPTRAARPPTYAEDIAPLLFENCAECHRPGEAGPFPLLTYADARKRGRMIMDVCQDRYMPPWHPAEGFGEFRDVRRLTEDQITLIEKWVEAKMPEGDPTKTPKVPDFPKGWQLGEPDLVVSMDRAFEVAAEGKDVYRWFSLPVDLPEDKWISGIEVRPSARSVVHHVLFFADTRKAGRRREKATGPAGFGGGVVGRQSLGGWAVGGSPYEFPEGYAMHLKAGSDIILQTHFHPSGKAEEEKTTLGIHFADKAPDQPIVDLHLPPNYAARYGLRIPAGEKNYLIEDHLIVPEDTSVVACWGHAHMLCTKMDAKATLPDGSEIPLLRINEWDFNWQGQYLYKEPVILPKGTRIDVVIAYDNSADNPNNPRNPPQTVRWGEESFDEMGSIILKGIAVDPKRAGALAAGLRAQGQESAQRSRPRIRVNLALRADKDGDGRLSFREVPVLHRLRFPKADKDGDGFLDREELAEVFTE